MATHPGELIYHRLPVALQNAVVAWRGRQMYRLRFGSDYAPVARFLEESERWSREEHRAYQEERLRMVVEHAWETVPYYRDVMDERKLKPSDIRTADDLHKLPLLTKEEVRTQCDRLISRDYPKKSLRQVWTSATTNSPLPVYWDHAVDLMNHACYMRARKWAGVPFGVPFASMHGGPAVPITQQGPPFWRYNPKWRQVFFSTLHLSDANLVHYVAELRRFGAQCLETYPSCAYVVAKHLESRGDHLPLKAVILTGEPLFQTEREAIEERFQAPIFDAYGQAERVTFASECDRHEGLHLAEEYGITEFLDEDGEPVTAGKPGLIVGTGLHNMAMPLLRYVVGDVGALSTEPCSCGRAHRLMKGLTSRVGDLLVTPDGRMLPSRMISWAVRPIKDVVLWRVTQERPDAILIEVVRDRPLEESELEGAREYLSRRLGPEVRPTIVRVDDLPRTARGKFRHAISKVPLAWGTPNRSADNPEF